MGSRLGAHYIQRGGNGTMAAAHAAGAGITDANSARLRLSVRILLLESAQHAADAQAAGRSAVGTIDRASAESRRAEALLGTPRLPGPDSDEYPPLFGKMDPELV